VSFSGAPEMYALFDNVRRARLGVSREEYARQRDNRSWQVELPPDALRVF